MLLNARGIPPAPYPVWGCPVWAVSCLGGVLSGGCPFWGCLSPGLGGGYLCPSKVRPVLAYPAQDLGPETGVPHVARQTCL